MLRMKTNEIRFKVVKSLEPSVFLTPDFELKKKVCLNWKVGFNSYIFKNYIILLMHFCIFYMNGPEFNSKTDTGL